MPKKLKDGWYLKEYEDGTVYMYLVEKGNVLHNISWLDGGFCPAFSDDLMEFEYHSQEFQVTYLGTETPHPNKDRSLTKSVALGRLIKHNIGVYPCFDNKKNPWKCVVQYHGKHISKSFKTKRMARNHWVFIYCRLHGLDYEKILKTLPSKQFYDITLK